MRSIFRNFTADDWLFLGSVTVFAIFLGYFIAAAYGG